MRFAYLDESGTNSPNEPWIVVGGLLINPDVHLRSIEKYLRDMADDFSLPEDRSRFCFHATQLYSGGSKEFQAKYSQERRHFFLKSLLEIPVLYDLPVFMHAVKREAIAAKTPPLSPHEVRATATMHASISCALGLEKYMRNYVPGNELVTLVYEENGTTSKKIRHYHNLFRTPGFDELVAEKKLAQLTSIERVAETAFFSGKGDSSLLQIADAIIYIFWRLAKGIPTRAEFIAPLSVKTIFCHSILGEVLEKNRPA